MLQICDNEQYPAYRSTWNSRAAYLSRKSHEISLSLEQVAKKEPTMEKPVLFKHTISSVGQISLPKDWNSFSFRLADSSVLWTVYFQVRFIVFDNIHYIAISNVSVRLGSSSGLLILFVNQSLIEHPEKGPQRTKCRTVPQITLF